MASLSLTGLTISRFGSSAAKMVYAGSLPFVIAQWQLSGTEAGLIQSLFNLFYALSLLVTSWAADHLGAKRVFVASLWLSLAAFVLIGLLARDYGTALVLFPLLAAALGGSYTPAIMLVAEQVEPNRRGAAIGWILAGSSLGYFAAIAAMAWTIPSIGLAAAWMIAISGPAIAAVAGTLATAGLAAPQRSATVVAEPSAPGFVAALRSRQSALLTGGYTAHCWELLGMWAWAPAFITLTLSQETELSPLAIGLIAAAAIHLSGAVSTLWSGIASDRWGRRRLLIIMALAGAVLSLTFGWSDRLGPWLLVALASAYGFATIGDSGVLSTAMTESVPRQYLGSMLALRSILGFGAGAVSPLVFGFVFDLSAGWPGNVSWGWSFAVLGLGGALAALCALLLPREGPSRPGG